MSTLWGDSNAAFYGELAKRGVKSRDLSVLALSVGEEELRGAAAAGQLKPFIGQLAAWNYFMSIQTPENARFVQSWKTYADTNFLAEREKRVTNDPMEATYIGIKLWAQAATRARSTDVENVRTAMDGQVMRSPSGFDVKMDGKTHHLQKPVFIGRIADDGQFSIVWNTSGTVGATP